jgi:NAD-dependent SIR2 family protein deacetylase
MLESPDISPLLEMLAGRRFGVLTGAGCSTESGIPDYRGPETRHRARNPIQYNAFLQDEAARTRYWARASIGWARVAQARPNAAHLALARMEAAGYLRGVVTQNVDRLHQVAGSRQVVELHGALDEVCCLCCGAMEPRGRMQARLLALNPEWAEHTAEIAPDGDAELTAAATSSFRVPACRVCNGPLKPNVVFFGETVPRDRVEAATRLVETAEALLVVGSSLAVYSGYRFVLQAARAQKPIALVNLGPTRGDALAQVRIEARCGEVLPRLAQALDATTPVNRHTG